MRVSASNSIVQFGGNHGEGEVSRAESGDERLKEINHLPTFTDESE